MAHMGKAPYGPGALEKRSGKRRKKKLKRRKGKAARMMPGMPMMGPMKGMMP